MKRALFLSILAFVLNSCVYRLPSEDDVSVLPKTNNPDVVGEQRDTGWTPSVAY